VRLHSAFRDLLTRAQISLHNVSGHVNHELVAIHHPSGTLLEADLLFNLPPTEQYSRAGGLPLLSKLTGGGSSMSPDGWFHGKATSGLVKDNALVSSPNLLEVP
jgi:hypothetical protein